MGRPTEALTLGETALAAHDKALGRDHAWTKDSARVTADALDALGRAEEAKALRERYGVTEPEKPTSSEFASLHEPSLPRSNLCDRARSQAL